MQNSTNFLINTWLNAQVITDICNIYIIYIYIYKYTFLYIYLYIYIYIYIYKAFR